MYSSKYIIKNIVVLCFFLGVVNYAKAQFPFPYCEIGVEYDVEPITYVEVNSVVNQVSNVINGTPAHMNFTESVVFIASPGHYAAIRLKGNTGGDYDNYFTVYVDWNENGVFEISERHQVGFISNSTGADNVVLTVNIPVPPALSSGARRMRIVKQYDMYDFMSCTASGLLTYGQAHDYILFIDAGNAVDIDISDIGPYKIDVDTVAPITYVKFGSIDNRSSEQANESLGIEDFSHMSTYVSPGDSLEIVLQANTNGNFNTYFIALVDWDLSYLSSGIYSRSYYVLGSVFNSTGTDSILLRSVITVPEGIAPGRRRMVIIRDKQYRHYDVWSSNLAHEQLTYNIELGQAEEYTVFVLPEAAAPLPEISFDSVLPVTLVDFAGIYREAASEPDSLSLDLERAVHSGMGSPGDTLPIVLKANTGGSYTTYFTVYPDWNGNGVFGDSGEVYQLGSITNSTGVDSIELRSQIAIPPMINAGTVKMRVVANQGTYATSPYLTGVLGQALDFTLYLFGRSVCY